MDHIDKQLLIMLQENARVPIKQLAEKISVRPLIGYRAIVLTGGFTGPKVEIVYYFLFYYFLSS